jgi:hypothetical protein
MKVSLRPLLLASATLLMPQISSATLLAGYNAFPTSAAGGSATETAPGFTGTFTGTTSSLLGSDDGTYGAGLPVTTPGNANNGAAFIDGLATAPTNFVITVTNGTANGYALSALLFDATTRENPSQQVQVAWTISNPGAAGNTSVVVFDTGYTASKNFGDYSISLLGNSLAPGGVFTATFSYIVGSGTYSDLFLDNIALVPEPGSLMALGCLMGGGAFFRSRRRRA